MYNTMTLADARNQDLQKFDKSIMDSVFAAADAIGPDATIKALCGPSVRNPVFPFEIVYKDER